MNARKSLILVVLFSLLVSACGASMETPHGSVHELLPDEPLIYTEIESPAEEAAADEKEEEVFFQPQATSTGLIAEQPLATPVPTRPLENEEMPPMPPGASQPPDAMYFDNYGVNPFVDTYEDHLSTFALDVDTASYSVARRYINDGNIPPAEAIRVEEFINYFEPGYAVPPDAAFSIFADGAASPFHQDGTYLLRFGVQGYEVPEYARKPASLTFVIDVSGSMDRENRLGLVKHALTMLVDRLRPDDSISIVVYGSEARVVLYPTRGDQHSTILNAIYALQPEGSTNAEAGLRLGYQMAGQAFRSGAINRVILCSDGVANVGNTGPDAILKSVRGYVEEGITLTSVGFGMGNYNELLS